MEQASRDEEEQRNAYIPDDVVCVCLETWWCVKPHDIDDGEQPKFVYERIVCSLCHTNIICFSVQLFTFNAFRIGLCLSVARKLSQAYCVSMVQAPFAQYMAGWHPIAWQRHEGLVLVLLSKMSLGTTGVSFARNAAWSLS
jgi:hypothetical protein